MDASPAVANSNPLTRLFNRFFTRHVMNMALLMLLPMFFAGALGLGLFLMIDPDIWWHLADARILTTTHHFIQIEPYSFTVAGERWVNPEWLSELPYWFSYRALGLRGIYLVAWLTVCANVLFVYWRGYLKARHAGAAFWAAGIAVLLMTVNSGPRTIGIAYLAMSAELAILECAERGMTRPLWLLPPLFCVWINLHGSWLIGFALLALYVLCGSFRIKVGALEQEAFGSRERNRLLVVLAASVAALFVNPYGWRLVWNPLDMMLNQTLNIATVAEWQPLSMDTLDGKAAVLAVGLMVVANLIRGRQWRIFELALVFFAWFAAIDHMRFAYLAAVITTPMLAVDIERSFFTESDAKTIPAMNALLAGAAVCAMVLMFPSETKLEKMLASMFPLQTTRSIQPSWRTFNWDYVGGRMAFDYSPEFIDSRFDTFEHHGVLGDYERIMRGQNSLELLDRYRVDHVLVQEPMTLSYLLQRTPGWKLERREKAGDGIYVLYARVASADGSASATAAPVAGQH